MMFRLKTYLKFVLICSICVHLLAPVVYSDKKLDKEDEDNEGDEDEEEVPMKSADAVLTVTESPINDKLAMNKSTTAKENAETMVPVTTKSDLENANQARRGKAKNDSDPKEGTTNGAKPRIVTVVTTKNTLNNEDDDYEDEGIFANVHKQKDLVLASAPKLDLASFDDDDDDDEEENVTSSSTDESKSAGSENYDDEDEYDEYCDSRLSSFVRNMKPASFLPDDFDNVTESMDLGENDREGNIYRQIQNINDTLGIIDRLLQYGAKLKNNSDLADTVKYLSSVTFDKVYEARMSPQCTADLLQIGQGMRNNEVWAWRFPDSFGSLHLSGLLQVRFSSFGEYEQCLQIKSPVLESKRHIYGRYCQLQMQSILPPHHKYHPKFETQFRSSPTFQLLQQMLKRLNLDNYLTEQLQFVKYSIEIDQVFNRKYLSYGVCFPHSCTSMDIARLFNRFLYPITKIAFKVDPALCDVHEEMKSEIPLDVFQTTAKYFFIILATIVIVATSYEIYLFNYYESDDSSNFEKDSNNNDPKIPLRQQSVLSAQSALSEPEMVYTERSIAMQIFLSFGAIRNSQVLGHIDNRYAALDTARFLLTFVMSTINSFLFAIVVTPHLLRGVVNTMPYELMYQNAYWFARTPGIWVDGFIFTIGVTIVLQQFNILKQTQGKFNYFIFLFKPWLHVSVLMIGAIMAIYLLPLYGSGPLWHITEDIFAASCKKADTVLPSFLMYSNWIGPLSNYTVAVTCNPTTWFISMTAQLYVATPIIFLSLYFCPGFGLALTTTILFISPIFVLSPSLFSNLHPYVELTKHHTLSAFYRSFIYFQFSPLQYVTAMCAGLLTGYLVKRKPNLQMPGGRKVAITLWWLNLLAVIGIFAWHCTFWEVNRVVSSHSVMAWFVVSKFVGLLWLGYTGYLCCTGRSKTLNAIFTIRWMQPIAKLSYTIYLLRSITIFKRFSSPKHAYEIEYWQTFQNLITDFWVTIFLAYLLYLLLEAPLLRIARIFKYIHPRLFCIANTTNYQNNLISVAMTTSKIAPANRKEKIPEIVLH